MQVAPQQQTTDNRQRATNPVAEAIQTRRTIHLFEPGRVPPEALLRRAIDLARWAPNHRLTEPWHFYLLGRETAEALAHLNADLVAEARGESARQAKRERWLDIPGWLLVTCRTSDDPVKAREDYGACCCAVQNLQLFLWSEGVGVKWGTGDVTRHPRFFDLLGLDPTEETVVALLWYGYPLEIPQTQRQPVEAILSERP